MRKLKAVYEAFVLGLEVKELQRCFICFTVFHYKENFSVKNHVTSALNYDCKDQHLWLSIEVLVPWMCNGLLCFYWHVTKY